MENSYYSKIKELKYLANKEIGQNFLFDEEICKRIIEELNISKDDIILEIGCGFGSLTYILSRYDNEIDTIDIDDRCIDYVKDNIKSININVIKENVLTKDLSRYTKIVSNLPYYITSSIIEKVLLDAKNTKRCIFMVQKEAYYRLIADKNTKDYSPLALLLKYRCNIKKLFEVNRNNFVPAPNVDSLVLSLDFKDTDLDLNYFYKILKIAFSFRRKTISNNLKQLKIDNNLLLNLLEKANIKPNYRCEQIELNDYINLTKILKQYF